MDTRLLSDVLSWFPFRVYRYVRKELKYNITPEQYKGSFMGDIVSSTLTIGGEFSSMVKNKKDKNDKYDKLNEQVDIKYLRPKFPIYHIGSNYGEHTLEGYTLPEKKVTNKEKKGNCKSKTNNKNIINDPNIPKSSQKYFNSQISMYVRLNNNDYKIKVFNNWTFQVPGVLNSNQSDVLQPIECIRVLLDEYINDREIRRAAEENRPVRIMEPVRLIDQYTQMKNSKTILSDPDISFDINALGQLLTIEARDNIKFMINSVNYTTQNGKIIIKFSRPTPENKEKETTLKILKQKINFEGASSMAEIEEIYEWLNNFIRLHYHAIIRDPDIELFQVSDSSDTDDESYKPKKINIEPDKEYATYSRTVFTVDPYEF